MPSKFLAWFAKPGDMALARSEGTGQRFYSMSGQIRHERAEYYHMLERAQQSDTDITRWQTWFLECLLRAIEGARAAGARATRSSRGEPVGARPFSDHRR